MKKIVYDLDIPALEEIISSWDQPAFRVHQIWQGLYRHLYNSSEQFTDLPLPLRRQMDEEFDFGAIRPLGYLDAVNGKTRKTLFSLNDQRPIETVLMRYDKRQTLCISTQVGCAMGCVFCATGQMGFGRNLSSGEIIAQVLYYERQLRAEGKAVSNIVVMGMGEPFHNYENTMSAIDRLNDPEGYHLGARRFTISTVGLVPQIRRFAGEKRQVNLAISLHAPDDESRSAMLPVNNRWNIDELLDACRYYIRQTGRRVTFEWALIYGINDTPEVAKKLSVKLKGLMCHVNAIPLNPTDGYAEKSTTRSRALKFQAILELAGIPCTIRVRRGIEIQAGCGQLAGGVGFSGWEEEKLI